MFTPCTLAQQSVLPGVKSFSLFLSPEVVLLRHNSRGSSHPSQPALSEPRKWPPGDSPLSLHLLSWSRDDELEQHTGTHLKIGERNPTPPPSNSHFLVFPGLNSAELFGPRGRRRKQNNKGEI